MSDTMPVYTPPPPPPVVYTPPPKPVITQTLEQALTTAKAGISHAAATTDLQIKPTDIKADDLKFQNKYGMSRSELSQAVKQIDQQIQQGTNPVQGATESETVWNSPGGPRNNTKVRFVLSTSNETEKGPLSKEEMTTRADIALNVYSQLKKSAVGMIKDVKITVKSTYGDPKRYVAIIETPENKIPQVIDNIDPEKMGDIAKKMGAEMPTAESTKYLPPGLQFGDVLGLSSLNMLPAEQQGPVAIAEEAPAVPEPKQDTAKAPAPDKTAVNAKTDIPSAQSMSSLPQGILSDKDYSFIFGADPLLAGFMGYERELTIATITERANALGYDVYFPEGTEWKGIPFRDNIIATFVKRPDNLVETSSANSTKINADIDSPDHNAAGKTNATVYKSEDLVNMAKNAGQQPPKDIDVKLEDSGKISASVKMPDGKIFEFECFADFVDYMDLEDYGDYEEYRSGEEGAKKEGDAAKTGWKPNSDFNSTYSYDPDIFKGYEDQEESGGVYGSSVQETWNNFADIISKAKQAFRDTLDALEQKAADAARVNDKRAKEEEEKERLEEIANNRKQAQKKYGQKIMQARYVRTESQKTAPLIPAEQIGTPGMVQAEGQKDIAGASQQQERVELAMEAINLEAEARKVA